MRVGKSALAATPKLSEQLRELIKTGAYTAAGGEKIA